MPIAAELAGSANEHDFVQQFMVPLLGRLGFSLVVNHHGKSEAGMDLIIGEVDRFAHVRYHGVQAKFENSIGKAGAHGLVQDAVEAFAAEFTHPNTGAKHRISSFYVANAGSISEEARTLFFARLQSDHGDNVRLLEGRDLVALDRFASIRLESSRNVLVGLLLETRHIMESLKRLEPRLRAIADGDGHEVVYPFARLRLFAVESWLANPVLVEVLPATRVEHLHSFARAVNRYLDEAGASPLHTVDSIRAPAQKALHIAPEVESAASELQTALMRELARLGPLATV